MDQHRGLGRGKLRQVQIAFTQALAAEGLWEAVDAHATEALVVALASGDRDAVDIAIGNEQLPLLLAVSDNGPQTRSHTPASSSPGSPSPNSSAGWHAQEQGWIQTLFGHVKGEWPHLDKIRDPGELEAELERVRLAYNWSSCTPRSSTSHPTTNTKVEVRPYAPTASHELVHAREARIPYRRTTTSEENQ